MPNRITNAINRVFSLLARRYDILCIVAYYCFSLYLGNLFSKTFLQSPLLQILGAAISFFLIVFGVLIAWIFYFITGYFNLTKNIYDLFPIGDKQFSIVTGLLVIMLVIACYLTRFVNRITNNTARLITSIISVVASSVFIVRVYCVVDYEYFFLYCIAGIIFCFLTIRILRNNYYTRG